MNMEVLTSKQIMLQFVDSHHHHDWFNTPENIFVILCFIAIVLIMMGLVFHRDQEVFTFLFNYVPLHHPYLPRWPGQP
jgi:hypothetical protein